MDCPGVGTRALRRGAPVDLPDLRGNVVSVGGAALLLLFTSRQHHVIRLHHAALYVSYTVEQRDCVAWHEISARGVEEGKSLVRCLEGRLVAASCRLSRRAFRRRRCGRDDRTNSPRDAGAT